MDNRQKTLFLGGALVAGAIIGFYILYKRKVKVALTAQSLPRKLVVKTLKDMRQERDKFLAETAGIDKNIEQVLKQNTIDIKLKHQINDILVGVCEKNGVSIIELREACQSQFNQDSEVSALFNNAFLAFNEIFLQFSAQKPIQKPAQDIPDYFTAEVTLNLMKEITKNALYKVNEVITDFKNQGGTISRNPYDQAMQPLIQALNGLDYNSLKNETLSKHVLGKFNEAPHVLYDKAVDKFSKLNPDHFGDKMFELFKQQKTCEAALMSNAPNVIILIEGVGSHLNQAPEELNVPTMRGFSEKLENDPYLQGFTNLSTD